MRDILNRFIDNLNGQFVEVSSKEALYQCMDLAYAWVFTLNIPKVAIQHQYAYQVFTEPNNVTREYFDIIPNTSEFIPQDGDLMVYKGGTAGHIVVCLGGGTTSSFKAFEQNAPKLGDNAHISQKNYINALGVLRPKFKECVSISDDETRSLAVLNDSYKVLKVKGSNESFGNLEGLTRGLVGYYTQSPEVITVTKEVIKEIPVEKVIEKTVIKYVDKTYSNPVAIFLLNLAGVIEGK